MFIKLFKIIDRFFNYFKYRLIKTYFIKILHFSTKINLEEIDKKLEKSKINPKKLRYIDFLKGEKKEFNSKKLNLVKTRLNSKKYIAYGEIRNNILAYSTWISLNETKIPITNKIYKIDKNHAFLEDSYCHSNYRGLGLHKDYNIYRLKEIFYHEKLYANVFVFSKNIAAIKTQKSSGLSIKDNFIVGKLFGQDYLIESKSIFYKILNLI